MTLIAEQWKRAHSTGGPPAQQRRRQPANDGRRLRGVYEGTTQNRFLEDWVIGDHQPRELTAATLTILRQRSRDLARHAPTIISAIQVIVDNVVGTGFRINPDPQDENGNKIRGDVDEVLERLWRQWSCEVDQDIREDLTMQLRTATQEYIEAGEVFFVQRPPADRRERVVRLVYEIVSAERVDHTFDRLQNDRDPGITGNRITASIEYNRKNQRVAYWISKVGQLGDIATERERITADRVYHLFHRSRAGQERGIPWIAGAAVLAHDLDDLIDSELTTAQVTACLTGWIEREGANIFSSTQERDKDDDRPIHRFSPGTIFDLAPGEKVNTVDPNRPSGAFEPFANFITRSIARTLGVSFEAVSGDWRQVNFASGRLGHLIERKTFRRIQHIIIQLVLRPMWVTFVRAVAVEGKIEGLSLTEFLTNWRGITNADFGGAGWEHHDPLKEVNAAATRIFTGLSTLDDETTALGRDWKAVIAQRTRELEAMEEAGVPLFTIGGITAAATPGEEPETPETPTKPEPGEEPDEDEGEGEEDGSGEEREREPEPAGATT
jgi:lambda family phage portal protein